MKTEVTKADENSSDGVADFLRRHGIDPDRLVSTGPATPEEIEAAAVRLGCPETHEQWLDATGGRVRWREEYEP